MLNIGLVHLVLVASLLTNIVLMTINTQGPSQLGQIMGDPFVDEFYEEPQDILDLFDFTSDPSPEHGTFYSDYEDRDDDDEEHEPFTSEAPLDPPGEHVPALTLAHDTEISSLHSTFASAAGH
ncbi:hypothetical protein KKC44_00005, partial [Patescibacteria group bacterium]|nr:hypothetical protein [Patescibacteria group bacterium]